MRRPRSSESVLPHLGHPAVIATGRAWRYKTPMTTAGSRLFASLALWIDPEPRDGPAQMACDEALLNLADWPVLRIFRWARPWVSAGYFVPFAEAQAARPDLPVCRRWTGGGVVVHDGDFTFSLAAPRGEPWAAMRPADSYRVLHEALAATLAQAGCRASLSEGQAAANRECFAGPVRHDIVAGGRKIGGGAQRRTRRGLLHQGSIQGTPLATGDAPLVACGLAERLAPWMPPDILEREITRLAREKYARHEFVRRA